MADAPTPGGSGSLSSLFAGNKRIPKEAFYGYLFSGIAVDVLAFWVPGAGDVYIAACRGMYWLNGYKTDKMAVATWVDAAIEAVPILSALPSATAFAIWTYAINVAETNQVGAAAAGLTSAKAAAQGKLPANENTPGASAPGVQGAANQNTAYHQRGGDGTNRMDGVRPGQSISQNTGYQERGAPASGAPTTAADKNIGYQGSGYRNPSEERGGIDGIRPNRYGNPIRPENQRMNVANDNSLDAGETNARAA